MFLKQIGVKNIGVRQNDGRGANRLLQTQGREMNGRGREIVRITFNMLTNSIRTPIEGLGGSKSYTGGTTERSVGAGFAFAMPVGCEHQAAGCLIFPSSSEAFAASYSFLLTESGVLDQARYNFHLRSIHYDTAQEAAVVSFILFLYR